ncbi:Signal transducer regulating beta-lactamase production, contains metallopeptidase domain [Mucilaginibacter sp. OK268]|uniref:M56 family metallopeptidase n=1 Tax=Mucilaginibacter sp. OK268 TaxID=1881048 RepID=UPI0008916E38|nr:M56 family metallopeptidase [Mucilaginibacter sp. OK268]SDP91404.1 Signal transducer regulating beta-lactamase production, contains metallopeptidase domain [Mucilaginibacter sp. OK268]
MEPLVMYLLKANVVMSILFLFYLLLLKNDKSFTQNRFYLLFSLVLSMFLPLLPELSSPHFEPIQRQITTANPLNDLYTTIGNSQIVTHPVNNAYVAVNQGFTRPSLMQILAGAYLLISTVLLARSIIKVLKISIMIKNTNKQFIDGIYYCTFDGTAPFSFFNYLVINKELFTDSELRQIIAHENVHIRQLHSIDILFVELVHAILWINPLLLYLKRCIKLNHEYIVDHEVINSGVDKKNYQLSILYNSLKTNQVYQLTNLYSSSKIKLRIKMMNLKKSPNANAYKYAFVLLLVAASYFLINPLNASVLPKNVIGTTQGLKKFEGYYELKGKNGALIQIIAIGKSVVLKQLWDNRKIDFTATGPLTFSTKENVSFTLQFTSDNAGHITQVLAFGKDVWVKNDNYHLPVEVKLIAQDLKKFEGYYELKGQKGTFIQISSAGNGLVLKQLWDNEQIDFAAKSPLDFFAKTNPGFTLQFTSDNAGGITQVLAFGKDVWVRSNNYHAPVEVKLTAQELKKFEGKYEFTEKEGTFIQITSIGNGLVLNQLWDNKQIGFAATGPLDFFAKTAPGFTLQFTGNNSGGITQVLAFGKDVWKKVN